MVKEMAPDANARTGIAFTVVVVRSSSKPRRLPEGATVAHSGPPVTCNTGGPHVRRARGKILNVVEYGAVVVAETRTNVSPLRMVYKLRGGLTI